MANRYIAVVLALCLMAGSASGDYYFYANDSARSLNTVDSLILLKPDTLGSIQDWWDLVIEIPEIDPDYDPQPMPMGYQLYRLYAGTDLDSLLEFLNGYHAVERALPVFGSDHNTYAYPNDRLVVVYKPTTPAPVADSLVAANGLELVSRSNWGICVYRTIDETELNSVEIANILYESGYVASAQPDMAVTNFFDFTPDDPYFSMQYYLYGITGDTLGIDVERAWDFGLGDSNIVVAVIDEAFQHGHPDMDSSKFVAEYDFVGPCLPCKPPFGGINPDGNVEPNPGSNDAHGMSVAGIISADTDNGTGMSGIAPNCGLMPLKTSDDYGWDPDPYPPYDTTTMGMPSIVANAIEYAVNNGAHVINGSFSWNPDYYWDCVALAIDSAWSAGVIGVFSSGNHSDSEVWFPANMINTVAVGAVRPDGSGYPYSCRGQMLDVVAPSGGVYPGYENPLLTLDYLADSGGYNSAYITCNDVTTDYMCGFGGTSAAAPQVAGILALARSRLPEGYGFPGMFMSPVAHVLKATICSTATGLPAGGGQYPPTWNPDYGFGLANAYRAVLSVSRGNVDNQGRIDIADLAYLAAYMFEGGPAPVPEMAVANINCSPESNLPDIADLVYLVAYLLEGGPPPPCPCLVFD